VRSPLVVVSADGSGAVAVWRQSGTSGKRSLVASTARIASDSIDWSRVIPVSNPRAGTDEPELAMSDDGRVVTAVWTQGGLNKHYVWSSTARAADNSATWGKPVQVSLSGDRAYWPRLAVSADGRTVHAVWYRDVDDDLRVQYVGATVGRNARWSTPVTLSRPGRQADNPDVATSADGRIVVAGWSREDDDPDTTDSTMQFSSR
jgi:hypothetical protein